LTNLRRRGGPNGLVVVRNGSIRIRDVDARRPSGQLSIAVLGVGTGPALNGVTNDVLASMRS